MTASKLTGILEKNRAAGILSRIPYIPAAFPEAKGYWNVVKELADNGADIIEIGVPFSDPIADGPVVAGASQKALANGGTLNFIFDGLEKHRAEINSGLVLMGYVNPFLQYAWAEAADCTKCRPVQDTIAESLKRLAARLAKSGVDGVIVPDLPLEESESWVYALKMEGIDLIALVGPNTGLEKMKLYAQSGMSGYVYVVSVMGTTGVRQCLPPEVADTLKRARQAFDLPLALGFGLSSPSQVEAIEKTARPDAAVFGSALIKHLESGGTAADFMAPWN